MRGLDAVLGRTGKTRKDIAALLGIDESTLSRKVNGRVRMIDPDQLQAVSEYLGCSKQELLETPNPPLPRRRGRPLGKVA